MSERACCIVAMLACTGCASAVTPLSDASAASLCPPDARGSSCSPIGRWVRPGSVDIILRADGTCADPSIEMCTWSYDANVLTLDFTFLPAYATDGCAGGQARFRVTFATDCNTAGFLDLEIACGGTPLTYPVTYARAPCG
jgi:hypothetical protein